MSDDTTSANVGPRFAGMAKDSGLRRGNIPWRRLAFPMLFLILLLVFIVTVPTFWSASTLKNVIAGGAVLMLVALAMTVVVSTGGIDLSVDTSFDLGAWFVVVIMLNTGLPWPVAALLAMAIGSLVGLINALLIARLRISPFLATLGVYFVGRSFQKVGTNGGGNVEFFDMPDAFHEIGAGNILGINTKAWIAAVVALLVWFALSRTVFGRRIEAIGMQERSAVNMGIPVSRYKTEAYVLSSAICALGGVLLTAQLQMFTPLTGYNYQTDAISAVFIGAAMHQRVRPNVGGTVFAVLFLSTVGTGLDLMGLDFNLKVAIRGLILVLALAAVSGLAKSSLVGRGR
ncbi:MAG: ABC transporter permease [Bifidobacterium sp.]|uniref:ABC transporter permease n=1 Tax=Bifidobacterium fermentum TaxID=3059035 RepID=A0AB39UNZ1_9BIFI